MRGRDYKRQGGGLLYRKDDVYMCLYFAGAVHAYNLWLRLAPGTRLAKPEALGGVGVGELREAGLSSGKKTGPCKIRIPGRPWFRAHGSPSLRRWEGWGVASSERLGSVPERQQAGANSYHDY